jgi:hypothetical protein
MPFVADAIASADQQGYEKRIPPDELIFFVEEPSADQNPEKIVFQEMGQFVVAGEW